MSEETKVNIVDENASSKQEKTCEFIDKKDGTKCNSSIKPIFNFCDFHLPKPPMGNISRGVPPLPGSWKVQHVEESQQISFQGIKDPPPHQKYLNNNKCYSGTDHSIKYSNFEENPYGRKIGLIINVEDHGKLNYFLRNNALSTNEEYKNLLKNLNMIAYLQSLISRLDEDLEEAKEIEIERDINDIFERTKDNINERIRDIRDLINFPPFGRNNNFWEFTEEDLKMHSDSSRYASDSYKYYFDGTTLMYIIQTKN